MVSLQYLRPVPNGESMSQMMRDAGTLLFKKQLMILDQAFKSRTGNTARWLADRSHISVSASDDGAALTIDYPMHIRFLDMKYSRYAKRKRNYAPIYNRYVWGFLMGYLYNNIRREMLGDLYAAWSKELNNLTIDVL